MLKKVRRRCRIEYWLTGLLFAGAAAMLIFALLTFLAAPFPWLLPWRLPAALMAAGAGVAAIWRTLPGDVKIARRLDRDLDSQERVQTLVENSGGKGVILRELRRETKTFFSHRQPKYRPDKKSFIPPALLTGAAAIILILSIVFTPRLAQSLAQKRELQEQQAEAAAKIEEIIQQLPENPLGEELAAELEALKEEALKLTEPDELETLLREAQELLEAGGEQAEAVESALAELLEAMNMSAEELAQAAADPEFAAELAEALNNLAQALPKNMNLAETLRELAENPSEVAAGQWQQVQEQLAQLEPAAFRESLDNAAQAAGLAENRPGDQGSGSGNSEQPGSGEGQGEGNGEGQGSGNGEGQGSGSGEGQGSGSGQGQGSGGQGAGTGSAAPSPSQYVYIPGEGEVILGGQGEAGEYTLRELLPNNPGLADDYTDFFSGYRRQALSKLSHSQVPRPLADYVRSYFEAIAPQGGK
ncbi:MAG: hypothetical protein PHS56_01115 [Eubacteriales bacterium]|nr:hypothetical protein [Eubacteriales bacterium]